MDEECKEGTVSYAEFLTILEGAIRTFMDFLKADKQNHCEKLKAFIRKKSSSIDRTLLNLLKKTNKKVSCMVPLHLLNPTLPFEIIVFCW